MSEDGVGVRAAPDEAASRSEVEGARQQQWAGRSFLREVFMGSLRMDWIEPFPIASERPAFRAFHDRLEAVLDGVDSAAIDETGEVPEAVVRQLKELGAFGMKIPEAYGGLGFDIEEYGRALELLGARDGSIAALLSAHQSIGLPQPLLLFGSEEQKQTYLPRCAAGAISAFALTEPDCGSDPARLTTSATRTEDGFVLRGSKLWITNGPVAELLVVMARHDDTHKISAFIVEVPSEGLSVEHRCRFMGLRGIQNGVLSFDGVRVPHANLIGEEGKGLKIAMVTLNTGRLSVPAACVGGARRCLGIARSFAAEREQWGGPVGAHEAISHKLADLAATTWAMESFTRLATALSQRQGYDIRLEAAAAKEWASQRGWQIIDETMQIRGGRGYETERSLGERGEAGHPVERMLRDARINRIFEGSSEIMHLFLAREMVDKHLQVAGPLLEPEARASALVKALPSMLAFYATWVPRTWFGLLTPFKHTPYGLLAPHVRYAERACRRLARNVFLAMVWYRAGLEKRQALLFRTVDIALEIGVMAAAVSRARALAEAGDEAASEAAVLADLHCCNARRLIDRRFRTLWSNDDARKRDVGLSVLGGDHRWLEDRSARAAGASVESAAK